MPSNESLEPEVASNNSLEPEVPSNGSLEPEVAQETSETAIYLNAIGKIKQNAGKFEQDTIKSLFDSPEKCKSLMQPFMRFIYELEKWLAHKENATIMEKARSASNRTFAWGFACFLGLVDHTLNANKIGEQPTKNYDENAAEERDSFFQRLICKLDLYAHAGKLVAVRGLTFVKRVCKVDIRMPGVGLKHMLASILSATFEFLFVKGCLDVTLFFADCTFGSYLRLAAMKNDYLLRRVSSLSKGCFWTNSN